VNRHLANLKRSAARSSASVANLVASASLVVSLLGLAACPGTLSFDPGQVGNPDTGGNIETSCANATTVLGMCTICHSAASAASFANLDLMSDGVAMRLVGVAAATGNNGMCGGKGNLLDKTTLPATGILIDKIKGTQTCGVRMPQGGMLSAADTACLQAWANGLVMSVP
jgi:hypothetical protein